MPKKTIATRKESGANFYSVTMLFVFPKAVRGALTNMIFILATVTQKGKGSYHRDHPPEQVGFKTDTKTHLLGAHNLTSPSMEGAWHLGNATTDAHADDAGDDIMYVGYGRDPWGPSTLMSSEEAGVGGSGRRGRGRGRGSSNSQRPRRNVVHLYNMVSCATGCNPITYKGYGCYCGFLGSGAPIDGIDRCCKMHDWCYNTADCPMFFEYFVPYLWKCYHHRPLCAIDHGIYGGPGSCAQRLCECDRLLSECLSHYRCPKRRAVCRSSPVRFLIQSLLTF